MDSIFYMNLFWFCALPISYGISVNLIVLVEDINEALVSNTVAFLQN